MVPELQNKKGVVMNNGQIDDVHEDWIMNFQLEIGNTMKTEKGGNGVSILLLHEVDKEDFGQGIFGYSKKYDGMGLYLNTILFGKTPGMNYI